MGDDLCCQEAVERGFEVLAVCKPSSPPLWYEWIADFERCGTIRTIERTHWDGKQRLLERYRYLNQVPLRDRDDTLMRCGCKLTITDAKGKVVYHHAWATTHLISDKNVVSVAATGRTRWKVENE